MLNEKGHDPKPVVDLDRKYDHEGIAAVGPDLVLTAVRDKKLYTVRVSGVDCGHAKLHEYYRVHNPKLDE